MQVPSLSSGCEISTFFVRYMDAITILWLRHIGMLSSSCAFDGHIVISWVRQTHRIAQFRTHYLTKERAYVSTQSSGQLNKFLLNHFSVYWKVALIEYSRMHAPSLSSGCEIAQFLFAMPQKLWIRQTHRHAIIILCVRQTHRHAIKILWVRTTHRHAIMLRDRHIGMLSSSCAFDRRIGMLSSSCAFDRRIVMLSSSCAFDRRIGMLSSSCAFDRRIGMLSSSCELHRPSACYHHLVRSTDACIGMLSSSCAFDRRIVMLSSSCAFDRRIVMLSSSCELHRPSTCYHHLVSCTDHRHAIIILWVAQTIDMLSSSCEFDRHIIILWVRQTHRHAIIILWVRQTHRHAIIILCVAQTIDMLSSSCEFDRHIIILWVGQTHRHAIIILWVGKTHRHAIIILWVRQTHHHLELDRHIEMLSSSCNFMLPKRIFWKDWQKKKSGFRRKHFSLVRSPNRVLTSRRQLIAVFDKPAFSRFSQNCEPLVVDEIFGKSWKGRFVKKLTLLKSASFEIRISSFVNPSKIFGGTKFYRHIGMLSSCEFERHTGMLSSSCEFDRHIDILWVRQTHRHLVSSTDTSTSCEFDRHIDILRDRHIDIMWVRQTHRHHVSSTDTSTSCEFDRHIEILRVRHCHVANKNCAISHPLLNEGTCIREYSKFRPMECIF